MFLVFFEIYLKFVHLRSVSFAFKKYVFVSTVLCSIFACRRSELTLGVELALTLSPGLKGKIFVFLGLKDYFALDASIVISVEHTQCVDNP
jgi:hypothetical protein